MQIPTISHFETSWAACESSSGPLHACSYNYHFPLTFQLLTDTLKSVRIVPNYLKDSLQTLAI